MFHPRLMSTLPDSGPAAVSPLLARDAEAGRPHHHLLRALHRPHLLPGLAHQGAQVPHHHRPHTLHHEGADLQKHLVVPKYLLCSPPSSAWPGPAGPATPSTLGWRGSH